MSISATTRAANESRAFATATASKVRSFADGAHCGDHNTRLRRGGCREYLLRGRGSAIDSRPSCLSKIRAGTQIPRLSDGITESLINSASELPHLKVICRSFVLRYKGREIDPSAVSGESSARATSPAASSNAAIHCPSARANGRLE